jgi:hypothetical protein
LGEDVANQLVEWFNAVNPAYFELQTMMRIGSTPPLAGQAPIP